MTKKDGKIEPNGAPPYEHSFFKWGSTNPEMVQDARRLMRHREQEQLQQTQIPSDAPQRCPKSS